MAPKKYTSWALSLMMALGMFVVSCSDETQESTSPVTTIDLVPTDTVPPTLRNVTPRNGLANVAISTNLTLEFSEALDADTLITNDTATCAGSVHLSATDFVSCVPLQDPQATLDNQSFTIRPVNSLDYDQTYRLKLTNDIRDEAGNRLVVDDNDTEQIISVFTTAADATVPLSAELLSKLELDLKTAAGYASRSSRHESRSLPLTSAGIGQLVDAAELRLAQAGLTSSEDLESVLQTMLEGTLIGLADVATSATIRQESLIAILESLTTTLPGKEDKYDSAQTLLTGLLRTGITQLNLTEASEADRPAAIAGIVQGLVQGVGQLGFAATDRVNVWVPLFLQEAVASANATFPASAATTWESTYTELGEAQVRGMSDWSDWSNSEPNWATYLGTTTSNLLGTLVNVTSLADSETESAFGGTVEGLWLGWDSLTKAQSTTTDSMATRLGQLVVTQTVALNATGRALNLDRIALLVQQVTSQQIGSTTTLQTAILNAATEVELPTASLEDALEGNTTLNNASRPILFNDYKIGVTNDSTPTITFDSQVEGKVRVDCKNTSGEQILTGNSLTLVLTGNSLTLNFPQDQVYSGCYFVITDFLEKTDTQDIDPFTIDTTPPVLSSLTASTSSTLSTFPVTLTVEADDLSGIQSYLLSESSTADEAANPDWQDWTSTTESLVDNFTLQDLTIGDRTIYGWVRDKAGNISNANSFTITLIDTDQPSGTVTLANGADYINSDVVNVTLNGTDQFGVAKVLLTEQNLATPPSVADSRWQTYTTSTTYQFMINPVGEKTLYAWFQDNNGKVSASSASDKVTIDLTKPIIASTNKVDAEASPVVKVELKASDNGTWDSGLAAYYHSEDSTPISSASTAWVNFDANVQGSFNDNITVRLSSGTGDKTVYFWVKDNAGNISLPKSQSITSNYSTDLDQPLTTLAQAATDQISNSSELYTGISAGDNQISISAVSSGSEERINEILRSITTRIERVDQNNSSTETDNGSYINMASFSYVSSDNITYRLRYYDSDGSLRKLNNTSIDSGDNISVSGSLSDYTDINWSSGEVQFNLEENVSVGGKIRLTPLQINPDNQTNKTEIISAAIEFVIQDNFEPHVAIQNNNYRGQDTLVDSKAPNGVGDNGTANVLNTSEMLVEFDASPNSLLPREDRWEDFYYFPKFNLSASLYDKSGFRTLSDNTSNDSIAETAEDFDSSTSSSDQRIANSVKTPLLATNNPTEAEPGTTAAGRNDEFYSTADYNAWNGYTKNRPIKLALTEPVVVPDNLTTFFNTVGTLGQANRPSGELSSNVYNLVAPADKNYLEVFFADWRTIDASQHFTDRSQTVVANTEYEGISKESLLQIVGLTDLAGNAATAGNARGVVFVDATPPLATSAIVRDTGDSVVLTIVFDQPVRGTDNFTLQGSGMTYTFNNNTVTRSSTESGSVFDNTTNTNTASYNVSGQETSTLTITIPDSGTSDFSNFFSALSHESTGSTNGTPGNTPSFYLAYDNITDLNYNSWSKVEFFDSYLVDNNGNPITPKLIGTDQLLPKIQAASVNDNASQTFLMEVTDHGLSIVSAFGTGAYDGSDLKGVGLIYSAGTTADGTDVNNATDNATTAINRDYPLYRFWNAADASESLDNQSNNNNTPVRAVIRFSEGTALSGSGSAYIRAILDSGDNATVDNASTETALLRKSIGLTSDANEGTTFAGDFSVKNNYLVVGIPDYTSGSGAGKPDKSSVDTDDVLVIDGVISGGVEYVLHISPPAVVSADSGTTLSESNNPDLQVFRKVHLDVDLAALKAEYKTSDTDLLSGQNMSFQFLENINSVSGITYTAPTTINNSDPSFKVLGMNSSAESAINETASFTLKSSELSGSGLDNIVGDGATLAFTATDFSGNANTYTIAFKLGHNQTDNQTNINDLEGSHIVPILNEISSTANSGKRRLQAP